MAPQHGPDQGGSRASATGLSRGTATMDGLLFFFKWVLGWGFPLVFCGICLWGAVGIALAAAFGRRKPRPATRAGRVSRVLAVPDGVPFFAAGGPGSLARTLGGAVGAAG